MIYLGSFQRKTLQNVYNAELFNHQKIEIKKKNFCGKRKRSIH